LYGSTPRYWGSTSTPIATSLSDRSAASRSTAARTAVTVPRDALVIRQNHSYVLRVTRANTVEQLDVTPGVGMADAIEVSGPLSPGDRLRVGRVELSVKKAES